MKKPENRLLSTQRYHSINSREWQIRVLVTLIAAFFRFYRLNDIPPGLNNDEAFNLLDILRLLQGQFSIFFADNTGREPFWFYLNTVTVALLGPQALALRVTAAIIGTATIALVYGFARALFRSIPVAALAALFTAISIWHVFYSRYGLRIILAVPLTCLALWFFWRGLQSLRRRDFILAGVFVAFGLYTYLSCRLVPFVLILLTGLAIVMNRTRAIDYAKGLVIAGVVALVIFLPLGTYFVAHPDDFLGHTANLSIFDARVNQGNISTALWNNAVSVIGMFLVRGDHEGYRNVPNRPVFDPFLGTFFVIGAATLLFALFTRRTSFDARLRASLLALWIIFFLLSSITSDDAPSFLRTLPALPAVMMLAAWGVLSIWNRLGGSVARTIAATIFAGGIITGAGPGLRDYIEFGTSSLAYLAFDANVTDTAQWINRNARASQVFIAPLWARQGTLRVMTMDVPTKTYESRDSIVLPANTSGKDAFIVYPWEQDKKADKLIERLGSLGTREDLIGAAGFPVAVAIRIPAKNLPDAQDPLMALNRGGEFVQPQNNARTALGDAFELLGYSLDATDPAKRNIEVTLFFHALKSLDTDYTFSAKARDANGRVWGQEDKWTGDNSYATTQWSPGDVVVEKFYPGLSACAPASEYRLTVEAYDPKTMQVLGDAITLGTHHADASLGNLYEHLEPAQAIDIEVAPQMRLLGYTLTPGELRVGESFSLSLYWRGVGAGKPSRQATIQLRDAANTEFKLNEQAIALPDANRGLCTFFDFKLPPVIAVGNGTLFVNGVEFANVMIR